MSRDSFNPAARGFVFPGLAALLIGCASVSFADPVYKSVDADGHVVYSDRASTPTARKSDVHFIQGNAADAARVTQQTNLLKAEDAQRKQQQDLDDKNKAIADHNKKVACDNARSKTRKLSSKPPNSGNWPVSRN